MRKNPLIVILYILLLSTHLQAQYPDHPLPQYPEVWNSRWITHPEIDQTAYNLIHFRNRFVLQEVPDQFIVHVSADNRYRLFVNGQEAGYGPQLADIRHWRYETLDLAPYLRAGENILTAEVMNWGVDRSYGIISFKTAFLMQGNSGKEAMINTAPGNNWKVLQNRGMHEKPVNWIFGGEIVGGFYAANPTDSVVAADYPWGWNEMNYDDSDWLQPEILFSKPKTNAGAGHGWILQPRTTAVQVNKKEPFQNIARSTIKALHKDFQFGSQSVEIPADSRHTILIDQGYVTLGYPKLNLSGGKDATIRVKYSEAMYDEDNHKGNRNVIEGKEIKGISDVYVMDGGAFRVFQPVWFRTFRFLQLDIQTENEPLLINDFFNVFSSSPITLQASFETEHPIYREVWDICWHGLDICAQDNLLSDAYYEQMQYVGDLRPHLMAWTALTGDFTYFHSALEQFNNSRLPDGNITSCYPLKATFVHPTYSLIWIDMLHDLMMQAGDKKFIAGFKTEIQEVFDYYESIINGNGLVGESAYPMFIDWYVPKGGNSVVNQDGNSAILTLNYAYTLHNAAEIMDWLDAGEKAYLYRSQARKYAEIVRKLCYDTDKGIYADDPEKTFYDQRASILAVLCGAHSAEEKQAMMQRILAEETHFDSKANLFYYFYLYKAMEETGVGDFTAQLKPWQEIVEMGMTATPEKRIEQHPRSEVHPWTAHPVHFYFSLVAGIKPASPGFETVMIQPNPGKLKKIKATYPTLKGNIIMDINIAEGGEIKGSIRLPRQMTGVLIWQGTEITLSEGVNRI